MYFILQNELNAPNIPVYSGMYGDQAAANAAARLQEDNLVLYCTLKKQQTQHQQQYNNYLPYQPNVPPSVMTQKQVRPQMHAVSALS